MATGDLHNKFCEGRWSGSRDMLVDRETDKLIAIFCSPIGGRVTIPCFPTVLAHND